MTETYAERIERTAAEYAAAREARRAYFEAAVARRYAEIRAEDKAAGRDTSGKSVAARRRYAYDDVTIGDAEYRRVREAEDAAEAAYREAVGR